MMVSIASDLETELFDTFHRLNLSKKDSRTSLDYLDFIRKQSVETYLHSIRVGLLSLKTSVHLDMEPKSMFFGGLLHDVGKGLIDCEILDKKCDFRAEDMMVMKEHPLDGYEMLKGVNNFAAEVALRHHLHQRNPYPFILSTHRLPEAYENKVNFASKIIALADYYDAITTRNNSRGDAQTPESARIKLLEEFPRQSIWIEKLYEKKIF